MQHGEGEEEAGPSTSREGGEQEGEEGGEDEVDEYEDLDEDTAIAEAFKMLQLDLYHTGIPRPRVRGGGRGGPRTGNAAAGTVAGECVRVGSGGKRRGACHREGL